MARFYRIIVLLVACLLVFSFLGFYNTFFGLFPTFRGVHWAVHFHALTVLCWFILLFTQAFLATHGRLELHRVLGRCSYPLAALIIAGFALVTNYGQMRHKAPDMFGAALFDGSLFLLFYVLAILNRKNTNAHAQYMILSALPFLNPGLGRFISPALSLPVEFLIMLALFLTAYVKKRPFRPYLVGMGCLLTLLAGIVYISVIEPHIIESMWNVFWG